MLSYVDYIEERSPQIIQAYRLKLEEKIKELLGDTGIDDSRIAQEVTIFADKICVDEETVRLCMATSAGAVTTVGTKPPARAVVDELIPQVEMEIL